MRHYLIRMFHWRTWSLFRIVQCVIGFVILGAGLDEQQLLIVLLGAGLVLAGLLRMGCSDNCATSEPTQR